LINPEQRFLGATAVTIIDDQAARLMMDSSGMRNGKKEKVR
jgi:hypothetical protein